MTILEGVWALGYLGFGLKAVENFMGRLGEMPIGYAHIIFLYSISETEVA